MEKFVAKARTKIVIEIEGKTFELSKPSVLQKQNYIKELSSAADNKIQAECLVNFIVSLGLPRETVENMEEDSFIELVEFINKKKT